MANPQVESGHTQIANDLFDRLINYRLTSHEWSILMFIIRKTYGFQKKADYITNSQICQATGLHKSSISRTITKLENRNMITKKGKVLGVQKDFDLWLKVDESATSEKLTNQQPKLTFRQPELTKQQQKVDVLYVIQKKKETYTKETIQKKGEPVQKHQYGELKNVLLSDNEVEKLKALLNSHFEEKINDLSFYIGSTGKIYKNHFLTLLNWDRHEKKRQVEQNAKGRSISRNQAARENSYTKPPEFRE